ncbi:MAG: hypothetical protein UY50_C0023G0013 [Parcubacteria group bacterium GW2011_GWA2_49_9]|nr:MAG: hypothetical protein UY50_C0023G0013 [Parcubacteria group bacterium GW2011_GWA2_49_9]
MRRILTVTFFLTLLFVVSPSDLFAQSGSVGTELSMAIFPEHPRPGEQTVISVESYNIDLNRSDVTWFVNDNVVKRGVGEKKITVVAGKGGERMDVRVIALGENGNTYSTGLTLRPAEVNLLWQAGSYTPPFYKGKALMPYQGTVLVAAIPSFTTGASVMPASSLIYTWKEGDNVVGDSSGKGKNLFVFRGEIPVNIKTISVTVESPDHTMSADATITVVPVSPRLMFYEEHPLYGILFGKALLGGFTLSGDELRISAIPYYFETDTKTTKDLVYDWQLNYAPLSGQSTSVVTLRRSTNDAGFSDLFLETHSTDENKSFQAAERKLTIEFPAKNDFNSGEAGAAQ